MVSAFKYLSVCAAIVSLAVFGIGCYSASYSTSPGNFDTAATTSEGFGPGQGGDKFDYLPENSFEQVSINPFSTFSIDVDTASYSKVRMFLMQNNQLPPAGAVRIEELINYFRYEYPEPEGDHPVATHVEIASCPWQPGHRLVRIGVQARHIDLTDRPPCNLVFLLDVSGSMNQANKMPLMKAGFERFVRQLRADDRVAIVVYASSSGLVLPSTSGEEQEEILASLDKLSAGGSTNGGEGIALAYSTVRDNFMEEGVNRIILCTDGDFNVGVTSTDGLVEMAAEQAKMGIYLSVLGFGMGNHNDAMLETLSNNAEGNYAFIDTLQEANKVLVEQMSGTLITVARDVKIQIEFNPTLVRSYRLIGYENRMLAEEDFNDDEVDAGEIGAGHTVTALYEVVPMGIDDTVSAPSVAPFRYQRPAEPTEEASSGELLTVNLRYKLPDAEESTLIDHHVTDDDLFFNQATAEFQFAAAVAEFGLLLRGSQHAGDSNYAEVVELATDNVGTDKYGYRSEFVELVTLAAKLAEQQANSEEEEETSTPAPDDANPFGEEIDPFGDATDPFGEAPSDPASENQLVVHIEQLPMEFIYFSPQEEAGVSQGFYIGKFEVTNALYQKFVEDTGYDGSDHPTSKEPFLGHFRDGTFPEGEGDYPVCNLNWYHAQAYCEWLSRELGKSFRLPTKEEWSYVAAGEEGRVFPWGDEWDPQRCNAAGDSDGYAGAAPVGSFPDGATPEGVHDLAGNIWEWCDDRALRGGPWCMGEELMKTSSSAREDINRADDKFGFRLVLAVESE